MKYTEHLVLAALLAPTAAVLAAVVLSLLWPHSDVSAPQRLAASAYVLPSDSVE